MIRLVCSVSVAVVLAIYGIIAQVGLDNVEKMSIVGCSIVAVVVLFRELKYYRDRDAKKVETLDTENDRLHTDNVKLKAEKEHLLQKLAISDSENAKLKTELEQLRQRSIEGSKHD